MPEKISDPPAPKGLLRIALRLPLALYRANLGWLLGDRFLVLTHTGRVSGKSYHTALEVVQHDRSEDVYFVAAGWGERSDWYRNLLKTPDALIQVGRRRLEVTAQRLPPEGATEVLLEYARRNPVALKWLARFMGYRLDGTEADNRTFAQLVPMIALRPR